MVPVCSDRDESHWISACKLLKEREIGGVIFMAGAGENQLNLVQTLQDQFSTLPLTFQDAEWGVGMRLREVPALPKNLTLGAIQDLDLLRAYGKELARQCRVYGVQGDFAPVCDVNTNPKNPVIGVRSLGDHDREVAKRAEALYEGMREGGLLAAAKHFPGHGSTSMDSHCGLPEIEKLELFPFQKLIDGGIDMVMVGHLLAPSFSSLPSSLSPEIIEGVLRKELQFDGVVITDSLVMGALSTYGSIGQICEKALLAGNDLLLFSTASKEHMNWLIEKGIPEAIDYLEGVLPQDLIDQKIKRINRLRNRQLPEIPKENATLTTDLFRAAITQVGEIPKMGGEIALVRQSDDPTFEKMLSQYAKVVVFHPNEMNSASSFSSLIIEQHKGNQAFKVPSHGVVCLFDTPYLLNAPNALIGYENHPESKRAVCDCLFGYLSPLGKLPVSL